MRKKLIGFLLAQRLEDLTAREASFLLENIISLKALYHSGLSIHTLARQVGLSIPEYKELLKTIEARIQGIEDYIKVCGNERYRRSNIFSTEEIWNTLMENKEYIAELLRDGYTKKEVYLEINVIPYTRIWEKFLRTLKQLGIEYKSDTSNETNDDAVQAS